MSIQIGDWVVIMDECIVSDNEDVSTYSGMIGCVEKIVGNNRAWIDCPMKVFYGKRPLTNVPISQLVKIDKADGENILKVLRKNIIRRNKSNDY